MAPECSLALMAGTSGLQGHNLCEVPISLSLLPDCLHPCYWGARLMVGGTHLSDGRCLEPSGMHLYLFWPCMIQTLYGLIVPQMCASGRSRPLFLQICIHFFLKKTLSESFLRFL